MRDYMKKVKLKKKRKFKFRLIFYAFVMFLGYELSFNVIMNLKLVDSNEDFIKALMIDSNYHLLYEKKADENLIALKRKDENNMTKNAVISLLFSATLLIGIMVCLICNIAISGNLTWSLIPISSIVFVWVVSFPSIILGKKGILISLISLSAFVIPYLFLLSRLIKVKDLLIKVK